MVRVLDAAGSDVVLVETVGVGQDELEITRTAHSTVVVMAPGLGDEVQAIKAGILECADVFAVNKADREGADRLEEQLHAMLALVMPRDGWHPPVLRTIATDNQGIEALAAAIAKFRAHFEAGSERSRKHAEHWRNRLLELLEARILDRVLHAAGGEAALNQLASDVAERRKDPFSAVSELLARSGLT